MRFVKANVFKLIVYPFLGKNVGLGMTICLRVVVATIAFGMGRYTKYIHWGPPFDTLTIRELHASVTSLLMAPTIQNV